MQPRTLATCVPLTTLFCFFDNRILILDLFKGVGGVPLYISLRVAFGSLCSTMNSFKTNWFSETSPLWPGQCLSLLVEEVLHEEKSQFQDIVVLKT